MECAKIVLKIIKWTQFQKSSKGEQAFLHKPHIDAIQFHHDIPKSCIVIECNRIALQTAIVHLYKACDYILQPVIDIAYSCSVGIIV